MAKKVVASLKKTDGKNYAKIIRAVKSEKTGAYTFKEEIVPSDSVKEALAKK
jgi:predicted thioesterase